jgi:alpha-L-fucosidase 2
MGTAKERSLIKVVSQAAFAAIAALGVMTAPCAAQSAPENTLWFAAPASDWEREGLPIGNGALGAMVMGGVSLDRLQLNEKSLWTA